MKSISTALKRVMLIVSFMTPAVCLVAHFGHLERMAMQVDGMVVATLVGEMQARRMCAQGRGEE